MKKKIDVGDQFSRWTVVQKPLYKNKKIMCRCECGTQRMVVKGSLRSGASRSCGCLHREITVKRMSKHGLTGTSEYIVWCGMRQRCNDPNHRAYDRYGGRGIRICEQWEKFENFLSDMGPRPSVEHSIDRIDNEKGYTPNNCRWATIKEQNNNKRNRLSVTK